jgi:hypothetical protein
MAIQSLNLFFIKSYFSVNFNKNPQKNPCVSWTSNICNRINYVINLSVNVIGKKVHDPFDYSHFDFIK